MVNNKKESISTLQDVLHHEIPLSRDMGVTVVDYDGARLTLKAPLENNINHKATAFGGSLYSLAVLSGWGLLYLQLKEQGLQGHIVIHESQVKYLKPVQGDIIAMAILDEPAIMDRFVKAYRRSGKARIKLHAEVQFEGELAVEFLGQYVVHR